MHVSKPRRPPLLREQVFAQSIEPPYTDPYVRWCGRGGAARLPPIPINHDARTDVSPPMVAPASAARAEITDAFISTITARDQRVRLTRARQPNRLQPILTSGIH